jgi:hypothetical protein
VGRNAAPCFGTRKSSTLWNVTRKRLSNACALTDAFHLSGYFMLQSHYTLFVLLQMGLIINAVLKATLIIKIFCPFRWFVFSRLSCGFVGPRSLRPLPIGQNQVAVITGFLSASNQEMEVSQTLALSQYIVPLSLCSPHGSKAFINETGGRKRRVLRVPSFCNV